MTLAGEPSKFEKGPQMVGYLGTTSITETGETCQNWSDVLSMRQLRTFTFPDGDVFAARNYCRNPNGQTRGPWCVVYEADAGYRKLNCQVANPGNCKIKSEYVM